MNPPSSSRPVWRLFPSRNERFGFLRSGLGCAVTALLLSAWVLRSQGGEWDSLKERPWDGLVRAFAFLPVPLLWNLLAVRHGAPRFWPTWRRPILGLGWGIAVLTALLVVASLEEAWNARSTWAEVEADLQTRGRPETFQDLLGPPPPEERDAAHHPLLRDLDAYGTPGSDNSGGNGHAKAEARAEQLKRLLWLPDLEPIRLNHRTGFDLKEVARLLGKTNPSGLPVPPPNLSAAKAVLHSLEARRDLLRQVTEMSLRPEHRLKTELLEDPNHSLHHPLLLKRMAENLQLRASARIGDGDALGAQADIDTLHRLGDLLARDPFLISFLVHRRIEQMGLAAFWEGVQAQVWDDTRLSAFQRHFAARTQRDSWIRALQGERLGNRLEWERLRESQSTRIRVATSCGADGFGSALACFCPDSWLLFQKADDARRLDFLVTLLESMESNRALAAVDSPWRTRRAESRYLDGIHDPIRWPNWFPEHLALELPRNRLKADRVLVAQRMAAVVCALERHRLAHGGYPYRLGSIDDRFREALPDDPLNGRPFGYGLSQDGSFRLYSVGNDLVDDGGDPRPQDPVEMKTGTTDSAPIPARDSFDNDRNRDWVWPPPVPTREERLF